MRYFIISFIAVALDQTSKLLVHFNMSVNEEIKILGNWFRIHYVLNPGMAFGIKVDFIYGKFLLTFFRLAAVVALGFYLYYLSSKPKFHKIAICFAFIFGGAIGNVIDSVLYGVFLENSLPTAPTAWFHGQVVDMLYFPFVSGIIPDWSPISAGEYFVFFRPIFNLADSFIFIGIVLLFIFQYSMKDFKDFGLPIRPKKIEEE